MMQMEWNNSETPVFHMLNLLQYGFWYTFIFCLFILIYAVIYCLLQRLLKNALCLFILGPANDTGNSSENVAPYVG